MQVTVFAMTAARLYERLSSSCCADRLKLDASALNAHAREVVQTRTDLALKLVRSCTSACARPKTKMSVPLHVLKGQARSQVGLGRQRFVSVCVETAGPVERLTLHTMQNEAVGMSLLLEPCCAMRTCA